MNLCDALGFADWKNAPDLNTNRKRIDDKSRITAHVTEAVEKYTYDEIAERLNKAAIPFSPVNMPLDLVGDKHLNEGERWLPVSTPNHDLKVSKLPIEMSKTEEFEVREQPACLGQHTDKILAEIGYTLMEIEALKSEKIVLNEGCMLNVDTR